MAKGDRRTRRGKIRIGSHGKCRLRLKKVLAKQRKAKKD